MININTLKLLNNIAFGADIDSLESYLIDFKQSKLTSNLSNYELNYRKLVNILKEIKPDSLFFTDKTSLDEMENDKFDKLFVKQPNLKMNIAYGINSDKLNEIRHTIDKSDGSTSDLVAIPYIDGIRIKCTYINGYLYKIHQIGESYKYRDITSLLKNKITNYINELSKYELVELRGFITILKNDLDNSMINVACIVNNSIRTQTNLDILQLVFDDIIIDTEETVYNNQWEKIEYINNLDINIPHHALIRNVEADNVEQALLEFNNYFDDVNNTDGIEYRYSGIEIRINNDLISNNIGNSIIYNYNDCDSDILYKSIVKSINMVYDDNDIIAHVNIVPVKCNDRLQIEYVNVYDISKLDELDIDIGKQIRFNVVEREAKIKK